MKLVGFYGKFDVESKGKRRIEAFAKFILGM